MGAWNNAPVRSLFLLLTWASSLPADTVFLFSLDGLGHRIFEQAPFARRLTALRQLAARGAQADGIIPAFPSTTANSHAALWTGVHGDVSHITANRMPALPREEHTFLDRANGFGAEQLAAEPLWVTAGRQGRKAVAYQATQMLPFHNRNTHPNAVTLNGYQSRQLAPHTVVRSKDLAWNPNGSFTLKHGEVTLRGRRERNGLSIEGVRVRVWPAEDGPPGKRALARRFSAGLYLEQPVPAVIYFRLFEYSSQDLLLYVSPIHETAVRGADAAALLKAAGGLSNNGYSGPLLSAAQAMETVELAARQNAAQVAWLHRQHRPHLLIGYIPFLDSAEHDYLGLYERGDAQARLVLEWTAATVNWWVEQMLALGGRRDHFVFTADHGMAPTYRLVNVNEALRRAGLGDHAVHVYNSVLINTTDWKGGTVNDRQAMRARVQAALEAVRDPAPVFTAFFTPEEHGARYGIGGPAASDLYFDLAPGYYVRDDKGELFPTLRRPGGNHGYPPDREDMLAVLLAAGPRIRPGTRWPRLRSLDVAPLVTDLAGISPPAQSQGKSPLR